MADRGNQGLLDDEEESIRVQPRNAAFKSKVVSAATVPFSVICAMLDKVSTASKPSQKRDLLAKFFEAYTNHNEYFPVMRLLLPQLDKERQTYGFKEAMLGKKIVEMLNIALDSKDAVRLINWRKPTKGATGLEAGDFGGAVYLTLKDRCAPHGDCSIADINSYLDQLNVSQDKNDRDQLVRALLRRCAAKEWKWLVRIILKELKVGLSEKTILNFFHPDAVDFFNVTNNLRKVCEDLKDPTARISQGNISLFNPLKPMLASRHPPEKVTKLMEGHSFCIETKFDGERVQIHKDGDQFRFWTRNANDCTKLYGPKLIPAIKDLIKVRNCIIDGELLVWDSLTERFEDFGKLKTYAAGARLEGSLDAGDAAADTAGKQLCYVAFDLLFVNGKSVLDLPLSKRMAMLHKCVAVKPHILEVVEQRRAKTTQDIIDALDQAIENREEGIIIKNLDSTYIPNERKEKWIKLKPEYVDGVGDDLDVLILAGFWGSGKRKGGSISHFLVGVKSGNAFQSLARVGSGYSDKELKGLQNMLAPHWVDGSNPVPPTIQLAGVFPKEKPDLWIDPRHSKILQIKAAQITPTDKYKCGYTLRFPRVVKIRTDKNWDQCMTLQELQDLAKSFGGRYAKRKLDAKDGGTGGEGGAKSPKKRKLSAPVSRKRDALPMGTVLDAKFVAIKSTLLAQKEFSVLSGDDEFSKKQIEELILSHSGKLIAYPSETTYAAISGKETLRIQNLKSHGKIDIIKYKWIVDCVAKSTIVALEPRYMVFAKPETKEMFVNEIDLYNDSYRTDATVDSLKEVFAGMFCKNPDLLAQLSPRKKARIRPDPTNPKIEPEIKQEPLPSQHSHHTQPTASQPKASQETTAAGVAIKLEYTTATPAPLQQAASGAVKASASAQPDVMEVEEGDDDGITDNYLVDEDKVSELHVVEALAPTVVDKWQKSLFDHQDAWWGIFRGKVVYLDKYSKVNDPTTELEFHAMAVVEHVLKFYGGTVVPKINRHTTHVIVDADDLSRVPVIEPFLLKLKEAFPSMPNVKIAQRRWVLEGAGQHDDLDERDFGISQSQPTQSFTV